jgi:hypothetical protein
MKTQWLDDFVRWFFNASPFWVDERKIWRPGSELHCDERREHPRDGDSSHRSQRMTRSSRS